MRGPGVCKSERGLRSSWLLVGLIAAVPVFADIAAIRELVRAGRFAEAVGACNRELRVSPSSAPLWTLKGFALQGQGDRAGGLDAFRSALRFAPTYAPALQAAAQLEFESKDPRARQTLETVLRLEPTNQTARAMLGELAFAAQDCPGVVDFLRTAEDTPINRWRRGVCLHLLERWQDAAGEFAALLALREHAPTRFNLAVARWRAGNIRGTLEALGPLDDPDAMSLRAAALQASNDTPKALEVLQAAVRRYPQQERLLIDLAMLCLEQNAIELGISVLQAGITHIPGSARLLTALGVLHVRAGDVARGEARFQEAIQLAPATGLGQVATASTMMQLGLALDAVKVLRKLPAGDPMVDLTLARALLLNNPDTSAIAEAGKLLGGVIAREPSNAAARSLLGKTLAQRGQWQASVAQFEAALRIDPEDRTAAYQLVLLYRRLNRTADSLRMQNKVRQLMADEKNTEFERQRYELSRTIDP
jgi:tetratricopeptide (TPR) repeat protein